MMKHLLRTVFYALSMMAIFHMFSSEDRKTIDLNRYGEHIGHIEYRQDVILAFSLCQPNAQSVFWVLPANNALKAICVKLLWSVRLYK